MGEIQLPLAEDRISQDKASLLVLCNGHGEDLIALRVLEALNQLCPNLSFEVLPLVGEGKAFAPAIAAGWLRRQGVPAILPSGGFSNQSIRGFVADILSGLFQNSWRHWQCARDAAKKGQPVLAVGDFLPLFFAWSSGATYGFIGTPKSDYTWRSGPRWSISDHYHRLKGSEWDPWEWALMSSPRCKMVAMRDHLTARGLKRHGVNAVAPGNPMMDRLERFAIPLEVKRFRRLLLLCGSRMPEALFNFKRLLFSLQNFTSKFPLVLLVALGSAPTSEELEPFLRENGYSKSLFLQDLSGVSSCWVKGSQTVLLGQGQFSRWAHWAEVGVATAGTATEQLVGLGIPALSLPGNGPQFKACFAYRQSRLLGGSVLPSKSPERFAERLKILLDDCVLRYKVGSLGARRMGPPGGSNALASLVSSNLLRS